MPENDECEAPSGDISLGDAYEQTFRRLCNAEALEAGLNKPRGPAARKKAFAEWRRMRVRVRAKNRRARAKWEKACTKARAEGLPLPDKPDQIPDEWPHPDDWSSSNREGERAYDDARDAVEVRMREAIARGELQPTYRDREGRIRHCIDRRVWAERKSLPGVGLQDQIHPASCPGPPELDGCFVSHNEARLAAWLEQEVRLRQEAERPAQSATAEAKAAEAETRVTAEIECRGGFMPQDEGAKFMLAIAPDYGRDPARQFVAGITGNDRRGPRGPRNPIKK
jgi:hypothetical protein